MAFSRPCLSGRLHESLYQSDLRLLVSGFFLSGSGRGRHQRDLSRRIAYTVNRRPSHHKRKRNLFKAGKYATDLQPSLEHGHCILVLLIQCRKRLCQNRKGKAYMLSSKLRPLSYRYDCNTRCYRFPICLFYGICSSFLFDVCSYFTGALNNSRMP